MWQRASKSKIQRGVRMYHDQTTRPLNDMRWETLTLLAHGAFVTMIDKTAFDGALDPVAYQRMGRVLGEARTKREHFGQKPVYDVGLYFSSRTRDWLGREEAATCAASPDYATASEHALVEDRVLFRNLLRALHTERRVVVDAPANVEAVVTDDTEARTLRVHLLAYNPTPRTTPQKNRPFVLPGLIEDKPIYRVTISATPMRMATALNRTTELQVVENKVEATIEDIHEVILMRY